MQHQSPQWCYNGKELTLFVVPSPLFVRIMLYAFAVLPPLVVLTIMVWTIIEKAFSPGIFVGLVAAVFISSRILRMALWNSTGKERISISGHTIAYQPDYGLMKGDLKEKMFAPLSFGIVLDAYAQDGFARLRIGTGENALLCVTKIRINELDDLLKELEKEYPVDWGTVEEELI